MTLSLGLDTRPARRPQETPSSRQESRASASFQDWLVLCRTSRAHSRRADVAGYVRERAPGGECSAIVGHLYLLLFRTATDTRANRKPSPARRYPPTSRGRSRRW